MKKIAWILAAALLLTFAGCGRTDAAAPNAAPAAPSTAQPTPPPETKPAEAQTVEPPAGTEGGDTEAAGGRVLVAYFSATGTTRAVAELTADAMGADLYELVPAEPYTSADLDYNDKSSRSSREMDDPACRPALSGSVENWDDYDVVFLGYPIWWGEAPRLVATFAERYDFTGKTVVTFCTSGSSANNDSSIRELVSSANWITGPRMNGKSRDEIADWIASLELEPDAA